MLSEIIRHGYVRARLYRRRQGRQAPVPRRHAVLAGVENKMGALLMQIEPDSPAARASLLPGDVVIRLDGVEINGVDDLIRALDHSRIDRTLSMDVLRLGRLRAIEIHPVGEESRRSSKGEADCARHALSPLWLERVLRAAVNFRMVHARRA